MRAPADQWHGKDGAMSEPRRKSTSEWELVASALYVGDVDRLHVADGAASYGGAVKRGRFSARQAPGLTK